MSLPSPLESKDACRGCRAALTGNVKRIELCFIHQHPMLSYSNWSVQKKEKLTTVSCSYSRTTWIKTYNTLICQVGSATSRINRHLTSSVCISCTSKREQEGRGLLALLFWCPYVQGVGVLASRVSGILGWDMCSSPTFHPRWTAVSVPWNLGRSHLVTN